MGTPKGSHDRPHGVHGEGGQRRQIELSGGQASDRPHRGLSCVDVPKGLARRADQGFAGRRELHGATKAVEHRGPELSLELPDCLRHRRLGHSQSVSGPAEAAVIGHSEEEGQPA
jgi:hypothetical protein